MKKRALAMTLALVLCLSLSPLSALAAGSECTESCTHAAATGGLHYDTLAEAIEDAAEGGTVTVLKDQTATATLIINKPLTLDLNTYTLRVETGNLNHPAVKVTATSGEVNVENGAITGKEGDGLEVQGAVELTLSGLTLTTERGKRALYWYVLGGSLTATGCTIVNKGEQFVNAAEKTVSQGYYAFYSGNCPNQIRMSECVISNKSLYNYNHALYVTCDDMIFEDCTVTNGWAGRAAARLVVPAATGTAVISGGTYQNTVAAAKAVELAYNSAGTLTLKDGVAVKGPVEHNNNSAGSIIITGGYFDNGESSPFVINTDPKPTNIAVRGGCYKVNDLGSLVTAPYQIINNADSETNTAYPYAIGQPVAGAKAYITATEDSYESLAAALAEAGGNPILLLADDESVTAAQLAGQNVYGNSHTLTVTDTLAAAIDSGVTLSGVTALTASDGVLGNPVMAGGRLTGGTVDMALANVIKPRVADEYLMGKTGAIAPIANFGALLNGIGYGIVAEACIAAVKNDSQDGQVNDVITMLKDYEPGLMEYAPYACYTIDLNGHVLGSLEAANEYGFGVIPLGDTSYPNHANITLTDHSADKTGQIIGSTYGAIVHGHVSSVILSVDGVKLDGGQMGLYFTGRADGQLTVKNGSRLTGLVGLGVKGGRVTVEDNVTITGTGDSELPQAAMSSGIHTSTGDAVYVECGYGFPLTLNLQGGNYISDHGLAVRMLFADNTSINERIYVTGGRFTSDPSAFVPGGYQVTRNGQLYDVTRIPTDDSDSTPRQVPVTGDGGDTVTIPVEVNVETGSAQLAVDDEKLTEIMESATTSGTVSIDLSQAGEEITSVQVPAQVIQTINTQVQNEETATTTLAVALPAATLEFDSTALEQVSQAAAAAPEAQVQITAETVLPEQLPQEHLDLVGADAVIIDLTVQVGESLVSDFGGGTVTITLNYTPPEGVNPEALVVWLLTDDGRLIPCQTRYENGKLAFDTGHFSRYVVGAFPFTDGQGWYYESLVYAYNNGLFSGVSDTLFAPENTMTRAMVVTVLHRMAGLPDSQGETPFGDVAAEAYYAEAVAWAYENQLVSGMDETSFAPDAAVTRQQLAAMLLRYAEFAQKNTEATGVIDGFADYASVDQYAIPALEWACGAGLIQGRGQNTLAPTGTATRGEVATILMRFAGI